MTWPALSFSLMTADEQLACVRHLAADGMPDHDIARLVGWNVEAVRRAIAEGVACDTFAGR